MAEEVINPTLIEFKAEDYSFKDNEIYKGEEVFINKDIIAERNLQFDEEGNIIVDENNKKPFVDFVKEHVEELNFNSKLEFSKISFDKDKGYLDKEGKPLFKEEELKDDKGNRIHFNENGDHVDEQGNILTPKKDILAAVIDDMLNPPADVNDVSEIVKTVGIELKDEEGNPIEFEDSKEGLVSYISNVIEATKTQTQAEALQVFFTNNPDIYKAFLHKQTYGSITGFNNTVSYSDVSIDADDKEQQKDIIRAARKAKGDTDEEISLFIEQADNKGQLSKFAEGSLSYLKEKEQADIKLGKEREKQNLLQQQEQERQFINSIASTVKQGKISIGNETFKIPENIKVTKDGKVTTVGKDYLIEYVVKPVARNKQTGELYSQYDLDKTNDTHENILFDAIMRLGGGVFQLVKELEGQNKVNTTKNIFNKNKKIFKSTPAVTNTDTGKIIYST